MYVLRSASNALVVGHVVLLCVIPGALSAQTPDPPPIRRSGEVIQAPYTAEFSIRYQTISANGGTETLESTEVRAVDSHRRRLTSRSSPSAPGTAHQAVQIQIVDPAARSYTYWTVPGDTITVQQIPDFEALESKCAEQLQSAPKPPKSKFAVEPKNEDLGTQTLLGIEMRGSRTVWSLHPRANEIPLAYTREVWVSMPPAPFFVVRVVIDEPLDGKMTQDLVRFDLGEPDPSLFQLPKGYKVVTRTADEAPCSPPFPANP